MILMSCVVGHSYETLLPGCPPIKLQLPYDPDLDLSGKKKEKKKKETQNSSPFYSLSSYDSNNV